MASPSSVVTEVVVRWAAGFVSPSYVLQSVPCAKERPSNGGRPTCPTCLGSVATIVPELDLFVVANFGGDGRVVALQLDSPWADSVVLPTDDYDWAREPWRWEAVELSGRPPADPDIGPYGRFQVIDQLGIVVATTRVDEPVFAARFR